MLALATRDGAQIAPVRAGPRFRSMGGSLIDYANPHARITLAQAQEGIRLYHAAIAEGTDGIRPGSADNIARVLAGWALDLIRACEDCRMQRRAAGYIDPHLADEYRGSAA